MATATPPAIIKPVTGAHIPLLEQQQRLTLMDVASYVDFDDFLKHTRHAMVQGGTGSGKTSFLFLLLYCLVTNKFGQEQIVWIDTGWTNNEYLSLTDKLNVRVFIPFGTVYEIVSPKPARHVDVFQHSPSNYDEIFDNLIDPPGVNVIAFGNFVTEPMARYRWIQGFFEGIHRWKSRTDLRRRMALFVDEFKEYVPARGESLLPEHTRLGISIKDKIQIFRKDRIRLVVSSWSVTDISKALRRAFHYWFIKHVGKEYVPSEFARFRSVIQGLKPDMVLVVDTYGRYNRIGVANKVPLWVKPRSFLVKTDPGDMVLDDSTSRQQDLDRWRIRMADAFLKHAGLSVRQRMKIFGYKSPMLIEYLEKTRPLEKCPLPVPPELLTPTPAFPVRWGRPPKRKPEGAPEETSAPAETEAEAPMKAPAEEIGEDLLAEEEVE
jgi:hypothetical protein